MSPIPPINDDSEAPRPISPAFRDPLNPTSEERAALRERAAFQRNRTRTTTDNIKSISSAANSGLTPLSTELASAQEKIAQIIARNRQRKAEEESAFYARGGECFTCRDAGPCGECERGQIVLEHQREERRRDRRMDLLRDLPPRCQTFSLATFPYPRLPAYRTFTRFLEAWDERRGLMLVGSYGTGKTGLVAAGLRVVAERWDETTHRLRFLTGPDLMAFLRKGFDAGPKGESYEQRLYELRTVRLLVIDDLGAERPTDWVQEQIFAIVNHRYEHELPTWATTNYGLDELAERINPRVLERLLENAEVIDFAGHPNLRRGGPR